MKPDILMRNDYIQIRGIIIEHLSSIKNNTTNPVEVKHKDRLL